MTDVSRHLHGRSLGIGAMAGALAYIIGYLVTYLWQGPSVEERLERINTLLGIFDLFTDVDQISKVDAVGWLFYNAHFVRANVPGQSDTVNFISEAEGGELLYALPIVTLLLAGVVVVLLSEADSPVTGLVTGVQIVAGYLPLAIGGTLFFTYESGGNTVEPEIVTAVFLAGLVYPLVFGGIGGAIGGYLRDQGVA
jgi:hypothetical protein